jgi:hypothetical protein
VSNEDQPCRGLDRDSAASRLRRIKRRHHGRVDASAELAQLAQLAERKFF